jgi:hypothetical protein
MSPRSFLVAGLITLATPLLRTGRAGEPPDYPTQIEPLFQRSCSGAFCHLGGPESGVDLTSYETTMASIGKLYGRPVVVPFSSATSPLWEKVASDTPAFGSRMPLGLPLLSAAEIERIACWIDAGALPALPAILRGDLDRSGRLEVTDPIRILLYLFLDGPAPHCAPVADADGDGTVALTDVVFLLAALFTGGPPPPELSAEEAAICR